MAPHGIGKDAIDPPRHVCMMGVNVFFLPAATEAPRQPSIPQCLKCAAGFHLGESRAALVRCAGNTLPAPPL